MESEGLGLIQTSPFSYMALGPLFNLSWVKNLIFCLCTVKIIPALWCVVRIKKRVICISCFVNFKHLPQYAEPQLIKTINLKSELAAPKVSILFMKCNSWSMIQPTLIKHILYIRECAKCWVYKDEPYVAIHYDT